MSLQNEKVVVVAGTPFEGTRANALDKAVHAGGPSVGQCARQSRRRPRYRPTAATGLVFMSNWKSCSVGGGGDPRSAPAAAGALPPPFCPATGPVYGVLDTLAVAKNCAFQRVGVFLGCRRPCPWLPVPRLGSTAPGARAGGFQRTPTRGPDTPTVVGRCKNTMLVGGFGEQRWQPPSPRVVIRHVVFTAVLPPRTAARCTCAGAGAGALDTGHLRFEELPLVAHKGLSTALRRNWGQPRARALRGRGCRCSGARAPPSNDTGLATCSNPFTQCNVDS